MNVDVKTKAGCSVSKTLRVDVFSNPLADFSYTRNCTGQSAQFADLSSVFNGSIVKWRWDFGDGAKDTVNNPLHIFNKGTYNVTLTAYSDLGCYSTISKSITISEPPVAAFITDSVCLQANKPVGFFDRSASQNKITTWQWSFGDGASASIQNPQHSFSNPNRFNVNLTITDTIGCTGNVSKSVLIVNPPSADFSFISKCEGSAVSFTDKSTSDGSDPISGWKWNYNNNIINSQNASYLFAKAGSFDVTLDVRTKAGCTASKTLPVDVYSNPVADLSSTRTCAGQSAQFADLSSVVNSTIVKWSWDFGDGAKDTVKNPAHVYNKGIYNVTLTAYSTLGCYSTISKSITISEPPVAYFITDSVCLQADKALGFFDRSASQNKITTWQWSFGDGASASIQNPQHAYSNPNRFNVNLTITDTIGCTGNVSKSVLIVNPPSADFSFISKCEGSAVSFTDKSTSDGSDPISGWKWNYNNNIINSQNASYLFAKAGSFDVTLDVRTKAGCTASKTLPVDVYSNPVADFSSTRTCAGQSAQFADLSSVVNGTIVKWSWDFGDGTKDNIKNPVHIFNKGTYNVTLTAYSSLGCYSTISKNIAINDPPVAAFITDSVCLQANKAVNFFDRSTGLNKITKWEWNFGDNSTSNIQNPNHAYSNPNKFIVDLTITDTIGCTGNFTKSVLIVNPPSADFSFISQCEGSTISFTEKTTSDASDPITGWKWNYNNNIINSQNASYVFAKAGTFDVTLDVKTKAGCTASKTLPVDVYSNPVADFSYSRNCAGQSAQFSDLSSVVNGTIIKWSWDFGDGTKDNIKNPVHTFNKGTYNVTLTAYSSLGCYSTISKNIAINNPPVAGFIADSVCLQANKAVNFFDRSASQNKITKWQWNFGDGSSGNIQNPNHAYSNPNRFNINLTITDNIGCTGNVSKSVLIVNPPSADFSFISQCESNAVSFTDKSSSDASDPLVYRKWDLQGVTDYSQNLSHVFAKAGTFDVTLDVRTKAGCSVSKTLPVDVFSNPLSDFTYIKTCAGQPTDFTDLSSSPNKSIKKWEWDFGDGNKDTLVNPSHVYKKGYYNVTLKTYTDKNCQSSVSKNIMISAPPKAAFIVDSVCTKNNKAINFYDRSTSENKILKWEWNFGDGSYSSIQSPQHSFLKADKYNVEVKITDNIGCTDNKSKTFQIINPPVADFSFMPGCAGNPVNFNDKSSSDISDFISSQIWDFGDGTKDNVKNPPHIFNKGNYNVTLTAYSNLGCITSLSKNIKVAANPKAAFIADSLCPQFNKAIKFYDRSTSENKLLKWEWNFGDGSSGYDQNPQHTYTKADKYNVNIKITDSIGCTDNTTKSVLIIKPPSADFTFINQCEGSTILFNDLSTSDNSDSLVYRKWNLHGVTDYSQNPSHLFTKGGKYNVSLYIRTNTGCSDSISKKVEIYYNPNADFMCTKTCAGQSTEFTDLSSSYTKSIDRWEWDFGDGSKDTLTNPTHVFNQGIYKVILTTYSDKNCQSSFSKNIMISAPPIAAFIADSVCPKYNKSIDFYDRSTTENKIQKWEWNFGDGSYSSIQNPQHSFLKADKYNVEIKITDSIGCFNNKSKVIEIINPPAADFLFKPSCAGSPVNFNDKSSFDVSDSIISRIWDFGNGAKDTAINPVHIFNKGLNKVTLTTYTYHKCYSSQSRNVLIPAPPQASFYSNDSVCPKANKTLRFIDESTAQNKISKWEWNFGDGSYSNSRNPGHVFSKASRYNVDMKITDSIGCTDNLTKSVLVVNPPAADFSPANQCAGTPVSFSDKSTFDASDPIVYHKWGLPNDVNYSPDFTYIFNNAGYYNVTLNITSKSGCSDFKSKFLEIYTNPIADFTFYPEIITTKNPLVTFLDNSNYAYKWEWNFGDGSNLSYEKNPVHLYTDTGYYKITEIVENIHGCRSLKERFMHIETETSFFIPNAFTPNGNGLNDGFGAVCYNCRDFEIYIFNRWGAQLFHSNDINIQWDGRFNGNLCPYAVYVYRVLYTDLYGNHHDKLGNLTLLK